MTLAEHATFYSEFERHDPATLIVGISGSGIIAINQARPEPISWMASFLRGTGYSFLTLTTREVHFWPAACIDDALAHHGLRPGQFDRVAIYGYSMGGWAAVAHATRLGARHVLAVSPRTPQNSTRYDRHRFGPVAPIDWPLGARISVLSDLDHPVERDEAEILHGLGPFLHLNSPGSGHDGSSLISLPHARRALLDHCLADTLCLEVYNDLRRAAGHPEVSASVIGPDQRPMAT